MQRAVSSTAQYHCEAVRKLRSSMLLQLHNQYGVSLGVFFFSALYTELAWHSAHMECGLIRSESLPANPARPGSFRPYRVTQQIVSVNICWEDLLSPTIFELKVWWETGVFFSSNFVICGSYVVNVCCLRNLKMPFWVRKKRPAS